MSTNTIAARRRKDRTMTTCTSEEKKIKNRAAQAAARKRKAEYVKNLEGTVKELEKKVKELERTIKECEGAIGYNEIVKSLSETVQKQQETITKQDLLNGSTINDLLVRLYFGSMLPPMGANICIEPTSLKIATDSTLSTNPDSFLDYLEANGMNSIGI
ncbi:hypothetical protein TWF481_002930 [Arthrobotrys musiformis]|uniref:BZIP domain-containing protein n=1 Tax=Arthrobotrys musiformis TaxID=47236 RepID=A0AAV9VRV3_9PEZI